MARPFLSADSHLIPWRQSTHAPGILVKDLGSSDGQAIQLVRFEPGARFPWHKHLGAEFLYVVDGEAIQRGRRLGPGCVGIAPAGSEEDDFWSEVGCTFVTVYTE